MQAAARYGCNEATSFLAIGHKNGWYGLSRSPKIAMAYFKDLFHSWANGVIAVDAYQYQHNKQYIDLLMKDKSDIVIPKSERQSYILDVVTSNSE